MGITGAPFGPIGMKICRATPPWRALARGKGFRVPGSWGVGKKLNNDSFSGHFVLTFLQIFKKMKKNDEVGQIRSDWAHIDSGRIPASSFRLPGGVGQFFEKIYGKMKIRIFQGETNLWEHRQVMVQLLRKSGPVNMKFSGPVWLLWCSDHPSSLDFLHSRSLNRGFPIQSGS